MTGKQTKQYRAEQKKPKGSGVVKSGIQHGMPERTGTIEPRGR
jgi:hypothetical protein